eukprot:scaffold11570_cov47-Attheya_sp.AAC.2
MRQKTHATTAKQARKQAGDALRPFVACAILHPSAVAQVLMLRRTSVLLLAAQTQTQDKEQKLTSKLDSYVEEHHLILDDTIRNELKAAAATNDDDATLKIGLQFLLELVNDSVSGSGSASETIRNLDVKPSPCSSNNSTGGNNNDVSISISQKGEENMCPREAIQLIIDETSVNMRDSLLIAVMRGGNSQKVKEEGETFSDQDINFPGGDSEINSIYIGVGRKHYTLIPVQTGIVSSKDVQTALVEIGIKKLPAVDIAKVLATLNQCRINFLRNEPVEIQELVPTEPLNFMAGYQAGVPASRAQAIVVAGESGSGKSRFIMDQLYKEKFAILRYSFTKKDVKNDKPPVSENREYEAFIAMVSMEFFDMKKTETDLYKSIRSIAKIISKTRDTWAFEKATKILKELIPRLQTGDEEDASNWFNETPEGKKIKLDRLAIVFDECGNHMDFVYGMISSLRDPILAKFGNLASSVVLVLCGAGLDAVRFVNDEMGTIGSDPDLSQLVLMKSPNLGALRMDLQKAIKAGSYSSILSSNARMLTMGIIPALTSEIVCKYASGEDLTTRQTAFGSFRFAMDLGVRVYTNLNGLKDATPENR